MLKNLSKNSPVWLQNLTAFLAVVTPILTLAINTLPVHLSLDVQAWLTWGMSILTAIAGVSMALSKGKQYSDSVDTTGLVGGRPDDRKP